MKRRLFNWLAILSLVLTVCLAGLWVVSYWRNLAIGYDQPGLYCCLDTSPGGVELTLLAPTRFGNGQWFARMGTRDAAYEGQFPLAAARFHALGFAYWDRYPPYSL